MFSVQVDKHFKKISGITNIEKMVPPSELLLNEALPLKTRVLKQRHAHQAWTKKKMTNGIKTLPVPAIET